MSSQILLACPHCRHEICNSSDFRDSRALFDGRFYLRFCRPTLTSVHASFEGARCNNCRFVVGGLISFIGCYGYFFLSGPFATFAETHEFYGPVHLFPGDDEVVRSFIRAYGLNFPYVLERYMSNQLDPSLRTLHPFPDSHLSFVNRHFLVFNSTARGPVPNEDRFMDSVLDLFGEGGLSVDPGTEMGTVEPGSAAPNVVQPKVVQSDAVQSSVAQSGTGGKCSIRVYLYFLLRSFFLFSFYIACEVSYLHPIAANSFFFQIN